MTATGRHREAAPAPPTTILVMMGVSGSGKSTVGKVLARRLGWPFKEGDELHPAADVEKMRAGDALTDADRQPWLRAIADWIEGWRRAGSPGVISCSALKRSYRDLLVQGRPDVIFVYLNGDEATLAARLAHRRGHFMPASLLGSQLADLEPPAKGEPAITVNLDQSVDDQVRTIIHLLGEVAQTREHRRGGCP